MADQRETDHDIIVQIRDISRRMLDVIPARPTK